MTDLWGDDFGKVSVKAPVVILREQASLLGQRTKGVILGKVSASRTNSFEGLSYSFSLVVPALDNYTYGLFSISHSVTELYPVTFQIDGEIASEVNVVSPTALTSTSMYNVKAENEEEFEGVLSQILKSQKTRKVLNSLLAQVSEPAI